MRSLIVRDDNTGETLYQGYGNLYPVSDAATEAANVADQASEAGRDVSMYSVQDAEDGNAIEVRKLD